MVEAYSAKSHCDKPINNRISFHCTACGKCCNSAPLMSIGELFYHESAFVGGLSLRRVKRLRAGDNLLANAESYTLSQDDAELLTALSESQLFKMGSTEDYIAITTQAVDYESLNRCPALNDEQACSIHQNRKPVVCSMVPFDASYPDSMQNIVLMSRQFPEGCIAVDQPTGFELVIANRKVVHPSFREALQKRRDDLCWEKQLWGDKVFKELETEYRANPYLLSKISSENSALLISVIPVLTVLAKISVNIRLRCLRYLDVQMGLLDNKIALAIQRKSAADKQTTLEFRMFKQQYSNLRSHLLGLYPTTNEPTVTEQQAQWIDAVEQYLGA